MRKDIPAKKFRSGKTARMMAAALTAVVGTFDTYMEGEYMYCTLRNAELVG